jgi:hypothetical protein
MWTIFQLNSENHLPEFITELHLDELICKNDFPKKYFKNFESQMDSNSIWRNEIQCNANMINIIDFDIFAVRVRHNHRMRVSDNQRFTN